MKESKEKFIMLAKNVAEIAKIEENQVKENQLDMKALWKDVEKRAIAKKKKKLKKRLITSISIAIAASFILLIWQFDLTENIPKSTDYLSILDDINVTNYTNTSLVTDNKVVELEDNASVSYTDTGEAITNSKINEKESAEKTLDIGLNKLITPKGKQASLTLSDGTKVRLNSGSKVICPTVFDGKIREVAVEGEVYFEVAHNSHKPFIVHTKTSELRVLGTSFCVRSYSNEESSHVVLLEGSVAVKTKTGSNVQLAVNQMAYIHNQNIEVKNVNPEEYIAWIRYVMMIREGQTVKQVIDQLENHYGISINLDGELEQRPILGKIFLDENVDLVLSNISILLSAKLSKKENSYNLTTKNK